LHIHSSFGEWLNVAQAMRNISWPVPVLAKGFLFREAARVVKIRRVTVAFRSPPKNAVADVGSLVLNQVHFVAHFVPSSFFLKASMRSIFAPSTIVYLKVGTKLRFKFGEIWHVVNTDRLSANTADDLGPATFAAPNIAVPDLVRLPAIRRCCSGLYIIGFSDGVALNEVIAGFLWPEETLARHTDWFHWWLILM